MENSAARRWCPQCQKLTQNAPLPLLATEAERLQQLAEQARGVAHRYYCEECRAIWQAVEVPEKLLRDLLSSREENHQLRHQIAMLRLLAVQGGQADASSDHPHEKAA